MQDSNEDVRSNAFNTLQTLVSWAGTEHKTVKMILVKLKRLLAKSLVDSETRDEIRQFLQDQG